MSLYSYQRVTHVRLIWPIITHPPWTKLSNTSKSTSFNNHRSFVVFRKPFWCCSNFLSSKKRMHVKLDCIISFVISIKRNRLFFKISSSWNIRKHIFNWFCYSLILITYSVTEVRSLIHVEPKSIKWNFTLHSWKLRLPKCFCAFLREVWESSIIWPNLTGKCIFIFIISDKITILFSFIIRCIVLIGSLSDSSIYDWNIMFIIFM